MQGPILVPRASTTLLASLIAHAGLLGVLRAAHVIPPPPPAPAQVPIELVPPAEVAPAVEPIAIEFVALPAAAAPPAPAATPSPIDDGVVVAPHAKAGTRRREVPQGAAAIVASITHVGPSEVAPPKVPETAPHEPAGLSGEFIDHFLANSKPLAPADDIPGERIGNEIDAAETALHSASTDGERMTARRRLVALRAERDGEVLHPSGGGTYESDQRVFTAHVNPDGTVDLTDSPNFQLHGLGASFDLTDWAMRAHGNDPYTAKKLKFLDETRDQRVAIGKRYRTKQLARSAELAQRNVKRLLARTKTIGERKQALFELWDECAETGDEELVKGGAAARRLILGVIRKQLTGDNAYTADELAAYNAKRSSTAAFAPYDD